jgi:CubicO group peptidase (beta-lactamase class C family)
MKMTFLLRLLCLAVLLWTCSATDAEDSNTNPEPPQEAMYFPPIGSNDWETTSIDDLGWNSNALSPLLNFLDNTGTRTFIILHKGKIVTENYFNGATANTNLPWFSAGKTLTAMMTGIAQEEGFLQLSDPSSNYLGLGWSSLTESEESAITVYHHLSMTTGLDYTNNLFCTDPECLQYLNPAGSFWYYHNAPYSLLQPLLSSALENSFDDYFNAKLKNPIGMQGGWVTSGFNRFYFSNARSMARFGLLCLNEGIWDSTVILNDPNYFVEMVSTSQNHNKAYGYLWWLNGQDSFKLPGSTTEFDGPLIPNAPEDLIAGLGANDQKLYVIPSRDLVIIRQGNNANEGALAVSDYDNELWAFISELIN